MEIIDSVDFSSNRGVITFPLLDAELNLRVETLTDVENSANIIRKIEKDDLVRVLTILDVATPSCLLETNEEYVSVAYLVETITETDIYPDTLKGIFVSSLSNVGLAPLIDEVCNSKDTFLVELFTSLLKQGVGSYSMVGVDDTKSYNEEEALRLELAEKAMCNHKYILSKVKAMDAEVKKARLALSRLEETLKEASPYKVGDIVFYEGERKAIFRINTRRWSKIELSYELTSLKKDGTPYQVLRNGSYGITLDELHESNKGEEKCLTE